MAEVVKELLPKRWNSGHLNIHSFGKAEGVFIKSQVQSNMTAMVSHELKNSIASVRGLLEILAKRDGKCECKEHFNIMVTELDRAKLMLDEYSELVSKRPVKMCLNDLNEILRTFYPLVDAKAIQTDKKVWLELGDIPKVYVNDRDIFKLITNLANNGLESMEPGGQLFIKTYLDGDDVVLMVKDQGKGIEQRVLDNLGTPFLTTKQEGTGLGLLVCMNIIERQSATFKIETGSNGTTFFVYFKSTEHY
ncbi:HAMP domain-containing sensor histidine kinase [Peptococcaceae bacterium 1198_IL3148]